MNQITRGQGQQNYAYLQLCADTWYVKGNLIFTLGLTILLKNSVGQQNSDGSALMLEIQATNQAHYFALQ
jgi:hypothetical protein